MLDFKDDISIKMGGPVGNVSISRMTDGQAIKFMSGYRNPLTEQLEMLWSFEIWHESFYQFARAASERAD